MVQTQELRNIARYGKYEAEKIFQNLLDQLSPQQALQLGANYTLKYLADFKHIPDLFWIENLIDQILKFSTIDYSNLPAGEERYEQKNSEDIQSLLRVVRNLEYSHQIYLSGKPKDGFILIGDIIIAFIGYKSRQFWALTDPKSWNIWNLSAIPDAVDEATYQHVKNFMHGDLYRNYQSKLWLELADELENIPDT